MACTPLTWDSTLHTFDATNITFDATEFCVEVLDAVLPIGPWFDVEIRQGGDPRRRKRLIRRMLLLG